MFLIGQVIFVIDINWCL